MFYYCPPKSNCFGHALRPANLHKAWPKLQHFLNAYFEPAKPQNIELRVFLAAASDINSRVEKIFGPPAVPRGLQWNLKPDDYSRAAGFILEGYPWPEPPANPIWLTFVLPLKWKPSVLPKLAWPSEEYAREALEMGWHILMNVFLRNRSFVTTSLQIPLSSKEPASYDFLGRFGADAPFKMNVKHFRVIEPSGKKGSPASRKPDPAMAARLREVIKG
jgi:hypothetical protein